MTTATTSTRRSFLPMAGIIAAVPLVGPTAPQSDAGPARLAGGFLREAVRLMALSARAHAPANPGESEDAFERRTDALFSEWQRGSEALTEAALALPVSAENALAKALAVVVVRHHSHWSDYAPHEGAQDRFLCAQVVDCIGAGR